MLPPASSSAGSPHVPGHPAREAGKAWNPVSITELETVEPIVPAPAG